MDVDWCLTCSRHIEGTGPYCSAGCQSDAASSPSVFPSLRFDSLSELLGDDVEDNTSICRSVLAAHKPRWAGTGSTGIIAWAAEIPSGEPAGAPSPRGQVKLVPLSAFRPPKLLTPHKRPILPTLCMCTSSTCSIPSSHIFTPQEGTASISLDRSRDPESTGNRSLLSGITESSIATSSSASPVPISPHSRNSSIFGAIATHVRSWVAPSPQPRPLKPTTETQPAKVVDPTKFTILAKTHHSSALHLITSPSIDDSDDDLSPPDEQSKLISSKSGKNLFPRSRRLILQVPLGVSDDHPAYRSRGRKLSRAVA